MKINFFGDGGWAADTLEKLVDAGHEIPVVVERMSPSDEALTELANRLDIPVRNPSNVNDPEFVRWIKSLDADLNLSVSYDQIIRDRLRSSATYGFINCHAGKLPLYRGRNVINWAIINDEREIGVTVHFMDDGIDTGDIIEQETLPIEWTDDYASVLKKVREAIPRVVVRAVQDFENDNVERIEQTATAGTYFSNRVPGDEWLVWDETSRKLYNKIRAITRPGPGAITTLDGRVLIVWEARYDPEWPSYVATTGEVVGREDDGVRVKTGDSTIVVTSVQFRDEEQSFVPRFQIGTRLGCHTRQAIYELRQEVADLRRKLRELVDDQS